MKKIIAYIFGLILLTSNSAFAADAAPLYVEYTAQPGEVVHGQISLYNNSEAPQELVVSKNDMENLQSLQDWLTISNESILLEPKENSVIPYEINVPEDAAPQGYYCSLSVDNEISHVVLLEVEGSQNKKVVLEDFNVKKSTDEIMKIEVTVSNKGNVHSSPKGTIEIIDNEGSVISSFEINKENHSVFPESKNIYTTEHKQERLGKYYLVLKGETGVGTPLEAEMTVEKKLNGELNILDKKLGEESGEELIKTLSRARIARDSIIVMIGIFLLTVSLVAIVKYCFKCAMGKKRKGKKRVVKGKKK
jgi:hypothetical protein